MCKSPAVQYIGHLKVNDRRVTRSLTSYQPEEVARERACGVDAVHRCVKGVQGMTTYRDAA